jgi:hypothetical protein
VSVADELRFTIGSNIRYLEPMTVFSSSFRKSSAVLLGAGLALAGACEEETEVTGIPLEQFQQQAKGATCERLVRCNMMPDVASCDATIPTDRGIVQSVAAVNAGELSYDPAAGRACVDAISAHKCEGGYSLPLALREICDKVFGSRKAEGEPCFDAAECQGLDAVCEGSCPDRCCSGTCRLAGGTGALGAPCGPMSPCAPDLLCRQDEMTMMDTCQAKLGPGESCGDTSDCIEGHGCDPATNTCFRQADSNAACNPALAAPGCAAVGEYCDAMAQKCLPLPGAGEACVTNGSVADACAPYATCMGGSCALLPSAGQSCLNGACLGLLECDEDGSTCLALGAASACTL